ncbi:PCBP-like protein [Niveomyces insectorum RCEF 264]|uniref:PCBP-like protein n=1 Tax=Niveomyces insectorum RCEF 264 TaxID=1081102 RepID=A0A167YZ11_9HYPO|nr:PCBP-like protein [Niveomyces insectorum RCEF 264]
MDDLSRSEYPAMLASLQPNQAVHVLQERVKRIGKVNQEIADWLQERRKVEEQYVVGLKKLMQFRVPGPSSELGVFQPSWDAIVRSVESIANSHHIFCQRIEKDVESPLRAFQTKKEVTNMTTISSNLQGMAKELEDAQERADKLSRKGGKANTLKVDTATSRLESATQQWESQSPFIFETLQALDEQRVNHLRDVLTQLETHEVDQATRTQATAEAMLNLILEIKTEDEIQTFAQRVTAGRPRTERRSTTRQSSIAGSTTGGPLPQASAQPSTATPVPPLPHPQPPLPSLPHVDVPPEPFTRNETPPESKLRSRIGTMLGRRRQSIHGGFGPLSPGKGTGTGGPFSRASISSHGRGISPRASSHNLAEHDHRLSSLAETPDSSLPPGSAGAQRTASREAATNGVGGGDGAAETTSRAGAGGGAAGGGMAALNGMTADELFGVPPPPGPPPSQQRAAGKAPSEPARDAEGFSVPAATNDPISQAQRDAAAAAGESGEDAEHAFKLNIQKEPVADEDAAASQAAMSNVANTLSMAMPSRKSGTVRGRRDVRNTIYVPTPAMPESLSTSSPAVSRSPTFASTPSRPSAVAALASEASLTGTSDSQSVRSATSLGSLAHLKHPEATAPGLSTSVIETVSATFEDGELTSTRIAGEIAFSYNADEDGSTKDTETIRINDFSLLEVIGPNRIFVQNSPSAPDEFTLDTSHLQQRASVGFTFRAHAEDATALAAHCPLVLKPVWKATGDKLGLLLQYRLNPATAAAATAAGLTTTPSSITLRNVVIIATYVGARASGVQTKPSGTHLKDKHLVYWRLGEVTLTEAWAKIVCRVVGDQGAEPQPGHIEARWEYSGSTTTSATTTTLPGTGITVSQKRPAAAKEEEADPFADDGAPSPRATGDVAEATWAEVPLVRQIVSGKYEAK